MTDQDSIRNLQKKYNEAMNTGDLNLYRDTMAEDVILIAPDHPPIRGKDGAADWIKGDFLDRYKVSYRSKFDEIDIVSDRAYAHGDFTLDLIPKDGGEEKHITGEFFDILLEANDEWKLKHMIFNFDQPLNPPTA